MPRLSELQAQQDGPRRVKLSELQDGLTTDTDLARLIANKKKAGGKYASVLGDNAITENVAGAVDAFGHHLLNLPQGIGQLAGHGGNALVQAVAGGSDYAKGVQSRIDVLDADERQRENRYQGRTEGNAGSYAGAVGGEVLPWVTGIGALRSAGMMPQASSALGKLGLLASEGALMGAAQPVRGENFGLEKAMQVGIGGATGPLLYGVGKAAQGIGRVTNSLLRPDKVANRRLGELMGGGDLNGAIARLRSAPEYVAGEQPTAATVLASPEAVAGERMLRNDPFAGPVLAAQDTANNAARLNVIRELAGDEGAVQAAIRERWNATQPFRNAALPEEGSKPVDPSSVVDLLKKLTMSANAPVRAAAKEHLQLIKVNADKEGQVPAFALDDIRQNVNSMLAKHSPNGAVGSQEVAKYAPVQTRITNALERAIPGYRDYLATYDEKSVPINTMESVGKLLDPNAPGGLNVAGDPHLAIARLRQVLRGDDKARYPMSDDARRQLEAVRASLQRRSIVDNKVSAAGPGTAAEVQRSFLGGPFGMNLKRAGGSVVGGLLGNLTGLPMGELGGAIAGGLLSDAATATTARVTRKVAEKASSAKLAAEALEAEQKRRERQRVRGLLDQYLLPYDTLPAR